MSSSVNQNDHSGPAPSLPHQAPSSAQRTQASQGVGNQKSLRPCAIGGERACKGRLGKSGEVHGELLEIGERAVVEGAFVSSPQDHAGRAARLQRFAPAGRTQTPAVAGPQAGKAELGRRARPLRAASHEILFWPSCSISCVPAQSSPPSAAMKITHGLFPFRTEPFESI